MTAPHPRQLEQARLMLAPYGTAMSTRALADLLAYRTTTPVIELIRAGAFPAIDLSGGRYSIPTETLIPWLATRLTTPISEEEN